jgi:hypothetical protein
MNGVVAIMIAAMPRCLHIYDAGFQCISETVDQTDFCESHQKVVEFQSRLEESPWRKAFLRLVAVLLLLMFLLPLFYSLRNLYWGPPVKAQEVW